MEEYSRATQPKPQERSALSPNGELFAGVVQFPHDGPTRLGDQRWAGTRVVVIAGSGRVVDVMPEASWSPSWSPDSKALVFLHATSGSEAQLWRWSAGRGADRVGQVVVRRQMFGDDVGEWFPDSRHVLVKTPKRVDGTAPDEHSNQPRRADVAITRRDPPVDVLVNDPDTSVSPVVAGIDPVESAIDLAVVDVATGAARDIHLGVDYEVAVLAPSGRHVALQTRPRPVDVVGDVYLCDVAVAAVEHTGEVTTLAFDLDADANDGRHPPAWSPDGSSLMLIGAEGIAIFDMTSGVARTIHSPVRLWPAFALWTARGDRVLAMDVERRLWAFDPAADEPPRLLAAVGVRPLGPSRAPVAAVRDDAVWAFRSTPAGSLLHRIPLDGSASTARTLGEAAREVAPPGAIWGSIGDAPVDLERIVCCYGSPTAPSSYEIRRWSHRSKPRRAVLTPGPHVPGLAYQRVEFTAPRDGSRHGAHVLTHQSGSGPVLVYIYPGSLPSRSVATWSTWEMFIGHGAAFAAAGYSVMIADSPGRTGMPNSAEETADAAVAAVEAAAAVGLCDPERAVLAGRSSGGHAVTLALTATDRFRAAITCSGPYNLTSWFGALRVVGHGKVDLPGAGLAAVGGRPWDAGHRCDLSPVFAVDSITTPLLLVHGALDTRVPVGQSDELFTALTVLNRPVTYFRAPDEEHSEWRPDAQARLLATTLEFLQKYTDSSSPGDARQKRLFAPIRG